MYFKLGSVPFTLLDYDDCEFVCVHLRPYLKYRILPVILYYIL